MAESAKKVVLAYSGGLDTSVILKWLIETYDCEVVTFSADLGQVDDMAHVEANAMKTGASKAYVEDLKEEFVRDYVFPAFRTNAIYEWSIPCETIPRAEVDFYIPPRCRIFDGCQQ